VEQFRDELSSKAQEEYKKLYSTMTSTLKKEEKLAMLDELENLMPAWSPQVDYCKGWFLASEGDFSTAIPLFMQSLKTSHLSMSEFINFENKVASYTPWKVLSKTKILRVLVNSKFQEFIENYFGLNAKQELQAIPLVQSTGELNRIGIVLIAEDDPRVSLDFAQLGDMYEAAGLIWSGVVPKNMSHADATSYCKDLGGGARLPMKGEWVALSRVMTVPSGKYNPELLPGTSRKTFWSSSVNPDDSDYVFSFDGDDGLVNNNRYRGHDKVSSVRCVRDA
jgi:hypothetical protein